MELVQGQFTESGTVAILPGSFHPPTVAHLGLARAALGRVAKVVFALPRAFPHKRYEGVGLEERLEMLRRLTAGEARFAVAVSDGGLFVDLARELRALVPGAGTVYLLCGRDAAERIVNWPYPENEPFVKQVELFSLLVAGRQGTFTPPAELRASIALLETEENWDDVSATRVREAIASGGDWRALVPEAIHAEVERLYSPSRLDSRNVRSR